MRDGFKVNRVHTARISAKVVDLMTFRDWMFELKVHPDVSQNYFPSLPIEVSISVAASACRPDPATIRIWINFLEKTLGFRFSHCFYGLDSGPAVRPTALRYPSISLSDQCRRSASRSDR